MIQKLISFLLGLFRKQTTQEIPSVSPKTAPQATQIPDPVVSTTIVIPTTPRGDLQKADLLDIMCQAIQSREGWIAPCPSYPEGSTSWKNKNPGNLRFYGQLGSIGKDAKGFAIFMSYETGYNALKNQILIVARGKSGAYPNPCSLQQFFNIYSPVTDNNDPISYCAEVARKMNVPTTFMLSSLL